MANSAQARKRARQAVKNRAHNASLRTAFRTAVKKVLKAVEAGDGRPAGPTALAEPHRHGIRERERRQHHPKNNAPRQLAAENAHGQIGGEKDKGKGKRAPSGVKAE